MDAIFASTREPGQVGSERATVAPQSTPIEGGYWPPESGSPRTRKPSTCRQIRPSSFLRGWLRIPVAVSEPSGALADIRGLGILHYDNHYEIVSEKTDLRFDSVWLAPRGSI
jgi:hypothetical protein